MGPAIAALGAAVSLSACIGPVAMGDGDFVHNYDYDVGGETAPLSNYTAARRDMPVNFVFYGPGVSIRGINAVLEEAGGDNGTGGWMAMPIKDSGAWTQDASRGRKDQMEAACGFGYLRRHSFLHMRFYDNPDREYLSNTRFGHYAVGTSHLDHNEGCHDEWSGYSENAEALWIDRLRCIRHLVVTPHALWMDNAEHTWRDVKHYMQSDGWATKVYIPAGLVPENVC